jgi:hypothetical protein
MSELDIEVVVDDQGEPQVCVNGKKYSPAEPWAMRSLTAENAQLKEEVRKSRDQRDELAKTLETVTAKTLSDNQRWLNACHALICLINETQVGEPVSHPECSPTQEPRAPALKTQQDKLKEMLKAEAEKTFSPLWETPGSVGPSNPLPCRSPPSA